MKKYILFVLSVCLLVACDFVDEEGSGAGNAVYMGNPNSSGVISMTVSNETGGNAIITPRLADLTKEPVLVTVALDKQILEDYNQKAGLELKPIAAEDFVFVTKDGTETHGEATVTIESGQFETSLEVKMKLVDEEKYPYSGRFAIPLVISKASKYALLSSPKSTIVRLNRQLTTSIARFTSPGSYIFTPKTPFAEPMTEWTLQMSAIYSQLSNDNITTFYMNGRAGGGEFYTRIHGTRGIQVKNGRDGDDTWTYKKLNTNVWLHISYVYKDASISVYVNGELQKKFETSPIYLGSTSDSSWGVASGQYSGVYIREVRFWKKALTEGELIDKLYLPQDPQDPNLLLYVPFTKTDQRNPEELTGNWNITYYGDEQTRVEYIDNVLFPADKLEIIKPVVE